MEKRKAMAHRADFGSGSDYGFNYGSDYAYGSEYGFDYGSGSD